MLNNMGLGFMFTAKDLASGVMQKVRTNFTATEGSTTAAAKGIGSAFGVFSTGLAVMGAGLGITALFDAATAKASEFGKEIALVATIADAATMPLDAIQEISMGLVGAFGSSPVLQAKALYQTISAGVTEVGAATRMMAVSNKLAIGGAADVFTVVDVLTSSVAAFASSALTAEHASDVLFTSTKLGKTTMTELSATFGRVAPTAAQMGVSFEEVGAAIAAVTVQGVKTEAAITGMHAALANISKPASDATAEASRLGIKFTAARLRGIGFAGMLKEITSSAKFNKDSMSKLFASVEAVNFMNAIGANNAAMFTDFLGQMGSAAGATDQAFAIMSETLAFQEDRFKGLKDNALILVGQGLEPLKTATLKFANDMLEAFGRIPTPIRNIVVKALAMSGVFLTVLGAGIALAGAIGMLVIGIKAAGITITGLLTVLTPAVALFAAGAVAVVGFRMAIEKNIGGLGDRVKRMVEVVKLAFSALGQVFADGGFSGEVREDLNKAENGGIKNFVVTVYGYAKRIEEFFRGIATGFSAVLVEVTPSIDRFLATIDRIGVALGFLGEKDDAETAATKFYAFGLAGERVGKSLSKVFDLIVVGLTIGAEVVQGFIENWNLVEVGFSMAGNAIGGLFQGFNDMLIMLGLVKESVGQQNSVWTAFGNVIAFAVGTIGGIIGLFVGVIRAAFAVVGGVVSAAASLFGGLSDIVTGVVFFLGGLFTLNWADMWTGAKMIVFGFVDGVTGILLSLVGVVAGVVDAIAGMFGKDLGLQKGIEKMKKDLQVDQAKEWGVYGAGLAVQPGKTAPAPSRFGTTSLEHAKPGVGQSFNPDVAAQGTVAMLSSSGQTSSGLVEMAAALEGGFSKMAAQPIMVSSVLLLDNEQLASSQAMVNRANANRSFTPTTTGGH